MYGIADYLTCKCDLRNKIRDEAKEEAREVVREQSAAFKYTFHIIFSFLKVVFLL
jgi:hypothetical protein